MHNPINENIILDACIMSKTALQYILERINPDDFYDWKRQKLFEVIKYLYNNKLEISISSIGKFLIDQNKHDEYKHTLFEVLQSWTFGDIKPYVDSFLNDSVRRKLDLIFKDKVQELTNRNYSVDQLCRDVDIQIKSIVKNQNSSVKNFSYLSQLQVEDMAEKDRYYMTGFNDLDSAILGFFQNDFNLLGARPSRGKTSWVLNILINIAKRYLHENVLFFSLEMPESRLQLRGVSQLSRINSTAIRRNKFNSTEEKEQVKQGMIELANLDNFYFATNIFKLDEIIQTAKKFAMTKPMSIMAIDYIQFIKYMPKGLTRDQALGDIGQEFKRLAKELHIPILGVSSLKRDVDFREDQRPVLADLRESGNLEYDSEIILFLYKDVKGEESQNKYFLDIAKNKDGPLLTIELLFNPGITLFENI